MNVARAPIPATASSTQTPAWENGASWKAVSIPSLETKPRVGGIAAMEPAAMTADQKVKGMRRHSEPRRRVSREPAWWSTTPTSMNREDLKSACAAVCTIAAVMAKGVPTPMVATIQPSWETVEYAVSFFRSVFCMANKAAISAVTMPMMISV